MHTMPLAAGRRPLSTGPIHSNLSLHDALRARASYSRTRDQLWEDVRLLTEASVRPVDFGERLRVLNGRLLQVHDALTTLDTWIQAQPGAAAA